MRSKIETIAETYKTLLVAAIIEQRGGNNAHMHALMDLICDAEGVELWEVIEAADAVNDARFDGESPFAVAAQIRRFTESRAKELESYKEIARNNLARAYNEIAARLEGLLLKDADAS